MKKANIKKQRDKAKVTSLRKKRHAGSKKRWKTA